MQASQTGKYSVVVSNLLGSATSREAELQVIKLPDLPICIEPVAGMVGWWPFDGESSDIQGLQATTLVGALSYAVGEVRQGILFDSAEYVRIASSQSLNVGQGGGMTIEGWINPANVSSYLPIAEWNNNQGGIGPHLWLSLAGSGSLLENILYYYSGRG